MVDVVGGAHDGAVVDTARYPAWGWVGEGPADGQHTLWGEPGPGRELYRIAKPIVGSSSVYLTAERTHRLCEGCGGVCAIDGCALCGTGLSR